MLVRRDGEGAIIPLTRPLFSRLLTLLPLDPMLGIMDLRDLGILLRGGALLLLLPLPTPAPPTGVLDEDDDGIGGLVWTAPRV